MSDIEQPAGDEAHSGPGPGATEAARELAAAHMVDLEEIQGTGAGGKITRADVEEHIAFASAKTGEATGKPRRGIEVPLGETAELQGESAPAEVAAYEPPAGGHAPKVWTGPRR